MMKLVRNLMESEGVSILFTEHDMDVVFGHADRVIVLNRGQVIASGGARRHSRRKARARCVSGRRYDVRGGIMLTVSNINSFYGAAHILHDVSLTISQGRGRRIVGS